MGVADGGVDELGPPDEEGVDPGVVRTFFNVMSMALRLSTPDSSLVSLSSSSSTRTTWMGGSRPLPNSRAQKLGDRSDDDLSSSMIRRKSCSTSMSE